jgi:hypothetical protein
MAKLWLVSKNNCFEYSALLAERNSGQSILYQCIKYFKILPSGELVAFDLILSATPELLEVIICVCDVRTYGHPSYVLVAASLNKRHMNKYSK